MTVMLEAGGRASSGALRLAKALGIKRTQEHTTFRPQPDDVIINWGCTAQRFWVGTYINEPSKVHIAGSKFESLIMMQLSGVQVPEFTTDWNRALDWLQNEEYKVIARTVDRGHAGIGMHLMLGDADFMEAPLYVKYVPKKQEYRVHVMGGEVVDIQQKRIHNGLDQHAKDAINYQIRTAANGWVYCRQDLDVPAGIREQAIQAVESLGLDFGAVDIGYTELNRRVTVYEVNTAPGLEGQTVQSYAQHLRRIINELL